MFALNYASTCYFTVCCSSLSVLVVLLRPADQTAVPIPTSSGASTADIPIRNSAASASVRTAILERCATR